MYLFELVGEDDAYATYEASTIADDVQLIAPGIAQATVAPPLVASLGFTRHVSEYLCQTDSTPSAAASSLRQCSLTRSGSAAVRAKALRGTKIDTQAVERHVGQVLVDRGFTIDLEEPEHELRAIFSGETGYLGWEYSTPDPQFSTRQPTDRPFFQPGSMDPRLARSLINLAGGSPGKRLLDPMCGTGGIVLEAGLLGLDVLASDIQRTMISGTHMNFKEFVPEGSIQLFTASASMLPLSNNSCDAVVFDAPYGRQSPIREASQTTLIEATLSEALRIAPRCVIVADRPLETQIASTGWHCKAQFKRRVHRSLDRFIYDLHPRK